jgi:large subunit ribosomal protein L17
MRHRVAGRHLGRDTAHRRALYRNLVTDLLRYERITTTEAKAKVIRPMAERIITLGRRGDLHARRQAHRFVYDTKVVAKVFDDIGPRMRGRPGGYLRITALEPRKGDGARMASIELVDFGEGAAAPRPSRVTAAPTPAASATTEEAPAAPHSDVMDRMVDEREDVAELPEETTAEAPPEALPSDELAPDAAEAQLEAEQQAELAEAEEAEERDDRQGDEGDGGAGPVR